MRRVRGSYSRLFLAFVFVSTIAVGATPRVRAAAGFPAGSYTLGEFVLTFADNGQFRVNKSADIIVEGEYAVTGDELRLTDKRGPMACPGTGQTGTYRWKYENEELTLTKVDDMCDGRAAAMTSQPWKRKM